MGKLYFGEMYEPILTHNVPYLTYGPVPIFLRFSRPETIYCVQSSEEDKEGNVNQ